MKTLLFAGSPHKTGDTRALIDAFTGALGGEIDEVDAYTAGISPCIDCRLCWREPRCSIHDPMQRIYDTLDGYDAIVIASPLHFSELTGPLLSIFGRFQVYDAAKRFRGETLLHRPKTGAVLLAGGGGGGPQRAIATARTILHTVGAEYVGVAHSFKTDNISARQDAEALEQARALALLVREKNA